MAKSEMKFPDEEGIDGPEKAEKEEKFKIEVIDDTPEVDRNRQPMPKEVVAEIEKDDLDEYSEKVQTRLKALKKTFHDERRAKEAAARERDEATRFAQAQMQENKALKERLSSGEKIFITEMTTSAKSLLESARSKLRTANASGDPDQIAAAQEELTDAKMKMREAEGFKPSLQNEEKGVQGTQQTTTQAHQTPNVDPKADEWRRKNGWFGTDKKMTALALGLHEELVESGIDPRTDEYYAKVDAEMKKRFSDYFQSDDDDSDEDKGENADDKSSKQRKKPATVVASASRSTGPRRVQLTTSQVAIAKRLGITNEAYVREMMKMENKQ